MVRKDEFKGTGFAQGFCNLKLMKGSDYAPCMGKDCNTCETTQRARKGKR